MCKLMRLPMDTFDGVRGDSESLAGLVLELAGEFPVAGTVVNTGDFDFNVVEIAGNRIKLIKVTLKK